MGLLAAGNVHASGGGGSSSGAAEWWDFFWRCLNLVIFLGLIWYFAGGKIRDFFANRKEQIGREIENMENRKAEAEKELRDVEQRIANLENERQEILEQARQQGESIKQSIIDKAYSDAEQIREQAKQRASQELEQEVQNLRAEMADRIVASAEKIISERLGAKEQEELIDKYLTKVVLN
jgi:F-type H+-transporting ATPase subunit b